MGKQKGAKGLILDSKFLVFLSKLVFSEDLYIKEDYDDCIKFFEKVLEQNLEQKDRVIIEKYILGFIQLHTSRIKFWKDMEGSYKREEGNGRTKGMHVKTGENKKDNT